MCHVYRWRLFIWHAAFVSCHPMFVLRPCPLAAVAAEGLSPDAERHVLTLEMVIELSDVGELAVRGPGGMGGYLVFTGLHYC